MASSSSTSMAHFTSYVLIFCVCSTAASNIKEKDLPKGVQKCRRNDEALDKCLLDAAESIRPFLRSGMPALGVPSIEPLIIPEVVVEQGTKSLSIKAVLTSLTVDGLSKYKCSLIKFDPKSLVFAAKASVDSLDLLADIKIDGKILLLPINGDGKVNAKINGARAETIQELEIIQKNGKDYLHTKSSVVKIQLIKPEAHFTGLFGNDTALGQSTNKLINENADLLLEELRPTFENIIRDLMDKLIFKRILENIPYDSLFPVE